MPIEERPGSGGCSSAPPADHDPGRMRVGCRVVRSPLIPATVALRRDVLLDLGHRLEAAEDRAVGEHRRRARRGRPSEPGRGAVRTSTTTAPCGVNSTVFAKVTPGMRAMPGGVDAACAGTARTPARRSIRTRRRSMTGVGITPAEGSGSRDGVVADTLALVSTAANRHPHGARRRPDDALPAHPARGGAEGGSAAHRHRLRRLGAHRQPRRRGQAEVVLHLLVRPEAARPARRGRASRRPPEELALTGGPYELRRTIVSVRVNPDSPYRVVARRGRRARALARRRAIADVGLPPMPEYYRHELDERQDRDGDGAHDPVGLPHLPHRAAPLPVLRCQGGVPLLRHQPQLAPAQAGGPPLHRREVGRGRARGARASSTATTPTKASARPTRSPAARSRARSMGSPRPTSTAATPRPSRSASPNRWIGKVVAQALPQADVQRYKDYGITIYHPNYEVWDKRLFEIISPGQGALRRARGVAPAHPRRGRGVRPALRDPELRRRRRDGEAVRLHDHRRGDRLDDRGPRLLHEPRHHAALHDLVPRAGDAARPRQPGRRAARVPHPPARGLPRDAREARPEAAAGLRRRRRPAMRCSRSARSWTRSHPRRSTRRGSGCRASPAIERPHLGRRGAHALARGLRRRAAGACASDARARWHDPIARPTW